MACATLETISGLAPSSETTAQWYLKLVTGPSFCPFTFISLWMPLALFGISLVFSSAPSFILYMAQILSRLSTRTSSSFSSSATVSMSSANRRLVIFLPPVLTLITCYFRGTRNDLFEKNVLRGWVTKDILTLRRRLF